MRFSHNGKPTKRVPPYIIEPLDEGHNIWGLLPLLGARPSQAEELLPLDLLEEGQVHQGNLSLKRRKKRKEKSTNDLSQDQGDIAEKEGGTANFLGDSSIMSKSTGS